MKRFRSDSPKDRLEGEERVVTGEMLSAGEMQVVDAVLWRDRELAIEGGEAWKALQYKRDFEAGELGFDPDKGLRYLEEMFRHGVIQIDPRGGPLHGKNSRERLLNVATWATDGAIVTSASTKELLRLKAKGASDGLYPPKEIMERIIACAYEFREPSSGAKDDAVKALMQYFREVSAGEHDLPPGQSKQEPDGI